MSRRPSLAPVMDADELNAFMKEVYPQLNSEFAAYVVTEIGPGTARVRLNADHRHLRPGDTVSGPSLFTLADIGGYACVLSHIGREALAVTTNLNINFMRKAGPGPVDGLCRILKLGRNLMVFDIEMVSDGHMVAHATGTYSIPPKRGG
ncbi:MAG: PaaI family thioesterase [Notoacmeibacter sp.]|nr:PaaI family thioesterase [Notoacmeibacter sp.]